MARKIEVEIVGDASSLERAFRRASNSARGFDQNIDQAGRGALAASVRFRGLGRYVAFASGAFLGGAGFVTGAKAAVESASNLNEQIAKTNVVFGDSAEEVRSWARTSATAMGLAEDQALAVASSFGALFQPLRIVGDEAARQSQQLSQLGADLASFYNTDVQDALDAIRSGIVGESEPLRRYGVLLSEVRVQQEALNKTGKLTAAQLTQQDKVLARVALIFRDTAQAQGDFERTSGGLANQTRVLKANVRDLGTTIGQSVTPVLGELAHGLNAVLTPLNALRKGGVDIPLPDRVRAALVPKLANDFRRLKEEGLSTGEAMRKLRDDLGGTAQAAELVAEAINFFAGGPAVANIARLRQEIRGIRPDAEAAAKALHGIAAAQAEINAAARDAVGRVSPAQQRQIAVAEFAGTGGPEEVAAVNDQLAATNRAIAFAQKMIRQGRGNAAKFAEALDRLFSERRALLDRLEAIASERERAREERIASLIPNIVSGGALAPEALNRLRDVIARQLPQRVGGTSRVGASIVQQAQFAALGLSPTGDALAPSDADLRRLLGNAEQAVRGTVLDTAANRTLFAGVRDVLASEFGKTTDLTRRKVKELLDALTGDATTGGPLTNVRAVTGRKLAQVIGAGLSPAAQRQIRLNITGAHFTTAALAGGGGGRVDLQNHIYLDGQRTEAVVTRRQVRQRHRTAPQTRGRVLP